VANRAPAKRKKKVGPNGGAGAARPARRRDRDVTNAAVEIFYERGYADATVQDIADELGILKGSLYHYIETKEDLLFQLIEEVHAQVQRILEEVEAEEALGPLERLELYVRRQVEYNIENLKRISIYYHDRGRLTGERLAYVKSARRVHDYFVTALISEAQEAGEASDAADARLLANCVFGTIIWTYQWYRPGRMSREAVVNVCAQHALHGIVG
jgi:TetR/AcrR family transcriptional regulator, cholesterol catabolism regulator